MATLTKLETKLAEVLGLAMAAQDATREVRGMLGKEHDALARKLAQSRDEGSRDAEGGAWRAPGSAPPAPAWRGDGTTTVKLARHAAGGGFEPLPRSSRAI
jgi:hypothetical protein